MQATFRAPVGGPRLALNPCSKGFSNATLRRNSVRANATLKHSRSKKTNVTELLVFLEAKPEASNTDKETMVDELLAMQFLAPGVLTASGGECGYPTPALPNQPQGPPHQINALEAFPAVQAFPTGGFTHMVHFRFSNPGQARAFLQIPAVKSALDATPDPSSSQGQAPSYRACSRAAVLAFEAKVDTNMDDLFRRQPEYVRGEDLILILRGTANCIPASATASAPVVAQQEAPRSEPDLPGSQAPRTPRLPYTRAASPEQQKQLKRVMMADTLRIKAPQDTALRSFVTELSLLAESSLSGAVQVTTGPVLVLDPAQSMQHTDGPGSPPRTTPTELSVADAGAAVLDLQFNGPMLGFKNTEVLAGPCHVFMARFPSRVQLQAFRAARPVTALWQQRLQLEKEPGSRMVPALPVCAELDITLHVAPTSANNRPW